MTDFVGPFNTVVLETEAEDFPPTKNECRNI